MIFNRKKIVVLVSLTALIAIAAGEAYFLLSSHQPQQTDYSMLVGDWVRPDGGYVLHIDSIHADGTCQVSYFNPNPINVAAATLMSQDRVIKLFVELRDVGYPGSKYALVYKPENDVLQGTYYQARDQETYNIVFLRKMVP